MKDINKLKGDAVNLLAEAEAYASNQITSEDQMQSSSSRSSSQKKKKDKKSSSNIQRLRQSLDKAKRESDQLRNQSEQRQANTPTIIIDEDSIELEYSIQAQGHKYKDVLTMAQGDVIKSLAPLIAPIIKVANAALQAQDLRKLKKAHVRDNDGKLTSQPLRDDGKQLYVTNAVDDLREQWRVISETPSLMNLLKEFNDEYKKVFSHQLPGVTTNELHKSGNLSSRSKELSSYYGEIKEITKESDPFSL